MKRKLLTIPGLALVAGLGLSACEPAPPPVYGGAVVEVENEPPPVQVEARPVVPYQGAVWIEGHWDWRGRWVWVPGFWERPRAGWVWVAHHWQRWRGRWRYVPGHWQRV